MSNLAPRQPHTTYRADIDGLRAVAVLLVIACHLGIYKLRGGFVGVDVFFVISGYLISSTILADIAASRFSIVSFYERRIRRILPALVAMLCVTGLFAYKYLLPLELLDFSKSLLASTASVSNIYFWNQSGYFDAPAAMKPLLHTWSLAVEEQFYIFFPVFLMLVRKYSPARVKLAVISVAALSFVAAAIGAFKFPVSTFYLAPTRAWELLLGTILSLKLFPELTGALRRNAATLLGIAMIMTSAALFSGTTPFPGVAALLPCFGTALIIAAGETGSSLISRILSSKPVVFVGLISYSLYLWHWPIIVFQKADAILVTGVSNRAAAFVVLAVTFLVSILSWKFVELPFRSGRLKLSGAALFQTAFASSVAVALLAATALLFHGLPSRFPSAAVQVASYLDYRTKDEYREGTCFLLPANTFKDFDASTCLHQQDGKKNYLVLGDSHAAQLWYGLASAFDGANIMQATAAGCKPTLEQVREARVECTRLMNNIFASYLPDHHVDALLIAARWEETDLPRLSHTIAWAKERGIKIVLFGPMVQYDSSLPRLLAASIKENDPAIPYNHRVAECARLDKKMLDLAAKEWGVRYVSFFTSLCKQQTCIEYAGQGVPLQFDYGHLTKDGSVLLAQMLRKGDPLP